MKPQQLRELTLDELKIKLKEMQEMLFRYRFQKALGQLSNPIMIRILRRDIARVKTTINQKI